MPGTTLGMMSTTTTNLPLINNSKKQPLDKTLNKK